jgi:hypothetical protein
VGVDPLSGPGFRSLEAVHAGAVPAGTHLERTRLAGNDALDARGVVGGGVGAALRAVLRGSPTPATSRVSRVTQPRSAMQTSLAYPT